MRMTTRLEEPQCHRDQSLGHCDDAVATACLLSDRCLNLGTRLPAGHGLGASRRMSSASPRNYCPTYGCYRQYTSTFKAVYTKQALREDEHLEDQG